MKKYTTIAFDLDGTLTNPERGLISSFSYALDKMNIKYESKEELKRFIGPPLYEEWKNLYSLSSEEATRMLLLFREFYEVYGWWDNEVYPGIPELLSAVKRSGKKIILATSKPEIFARKILRFFGIAEYFDFMGGAATDKTRDKKHEVLEYSMNAVGASSEETVMVGDRKFDAEGAKILGVDSIAVLYGHGAPDEISAAPFTYVARDLSHLQKMLTEN